MFKIFETVGWLTMLSALLEYEQASYLAWRLWPVLTFVVGGVVLLNTSIRWALRLPEELAVEAETRRKSKWFSWGSKKAKKSKKA